MLSVILSTHNEASNSFFENILNNLPKTNKVEIIIVDFNSIDSTLEIAKQHQLKNQNIIILSTNLNSRAARLNYGIKHAKFELILLNHPRSLVQVEGIEYLLKHESTHGLRCCQKRTTCEILPRQQPTL